MRSRLLTLALLGALALAAAPAQGQPTPSIATRPAATLLLPYFEVDLANPAGENTIFTVSNASATATLAHVTVWSAMHVPVFSFDVYLTGYDTQPINVRNILNGALPGTATNTEDPTDAISPQGPASQDIGLPGCAGILPPPPVPQATVDHVKASLTGQPSALVGGMCATSGDGSRVARGYITVDATNTCTTSMPGDPGYFVTGGLGVATNENVLFGDYVLTNHIGGTERSDGGTLVHITANGTDPQTSANGEYTFYGRVVGWDASDNREPLANSFMLRFINGGGFTATNLIVWRDTKVDQDYFACGTPPAWYPLGQRDITLWDEQENPNISTLVPFGPQPPLSGLRPFPSGTQRVPLGGVQLPTVTDFGFMHLNLGALVTGAEMFPPDDLAGSGRTSQAWVTASIKRGRYSVGWTATALDSAKGTFSFVVTP